MRILAITDLHGNDQALQKILAHAGPVGLILLGGDLTNFGTPDQAQRLVEQAQASGTVVRAVAGNCDSAQIDQRLAKLGVSLHGAGRIEHGIGLQGLSAMPPWGRTMYQFTEEELARLLAAGYEPLQGIRPHVVLSHAPPRGGKVDRTFLGKHVGSTALRDFIESTQPDLVLCGHIHEGRGTTRVGSTTVVNCGVGGKRYYAVVEVRAEVGHEIRGQLCRA